jgi:hypothetical protein
MLLGGLADRYHSCRTSDIPQHVYLVVCNITRNIYDITHGEINNTRSRYLRTYIQEKRM